MPEMPIDKPAMTTTMTHTPISTIPDISVPALPNKPEIAKVVDVAIGDTLKNNVTVLPTQEVPSSVTSHEVIPATVIPTVNPDTVISATAIPATVKPTVISTTVIPDTVKPAVIPDTVISTTAIPATVIPEAHVSVNPYADAVAVKTNAVKSKEVKDELKESSDDSASEEE